MQEQARLPVLTIRDTVPFPRMIAGILVTRSDSIEAIRRAHGADRRILAIWDGDADPEDSPEQLPKIGTACVIQDLQDHGRQLNVVILGIARFRIDKYDQDESGVLYADGFYIKENPAPDDEYLKALTHYLRDLVLKTIEVGNLPTDLKAVVQSDGSTAPEVLADMVAAHLNVPTKNLQRILEAIHPQDRLTAVITELYQLLERTQIQRQIQNQVIESIGERYRESILREHLRIIRKELGEDDDPDRLEEMFQNLELPPIVREEVERQLKRIRSTSPLSPEYQVIRHYLEIIAELPWNRVTQDHIDLRRARKILDEDHYGLDDVKDRVIEFLAVRGLQIAKEEKDGSGRAPILLFVGPPGVGKTSVAISIAKAMGREHARIALGGVRDEADIRGHRRTYVGAMPGRIIQAIRQAKSRNPVLILDEVDKLGRGLQGDPAAALLEVLDPAQNHQFVDHYLGVPFDLSQVLFIATANTIDRIPAPLFDRMELVEFRGYTEAEKIVIARKHLLPRLFEENAIPEGRVAITTPALQSIINEYTHEAGVRGLEKSLARILRRTAREIVESNPEKIQISKPDLDRYLGQPNVRKTKPLPQPRVGVATGMFYTPAGGDILFVEAAIAPGKGRVTVTGHVGDVMRESAFAGLTCAKQFAGHEKPLDVHVHVPAGAIPKDGPSAGITITTAIASAITQRPVRPDVAMTGEITISGRVLPVGGIREKVLGAYRAGIRDIILPRENQPDLDQIPEDVRKKITFHLVETIDDVFRVVFADR